MLVKVELFIFPADFVILDCEVDFEVPIILGSFLATGRALVDMEKGQMKFWFNNDEATFNICRTMRQSGELQSLSAISHKEKMKKERCEMEAARRASLAEEEARQMRAEELAAGASSSRTVEIVGSIADSVVDAEDTTEGVQITEVVGSGEPNPPTC